MMSKERIAVGSSGREGSVEGGREFVERVEMKATRAASSSEGVRETGRGVEVVVMGGFLGLGFCLYVLHRLSVPVPTPSVFGRRTVKDAGWRELVETVHRQTESKAKRMSAVKRLRLRRGRLEGKIEE